MTIMTMRILQGVLTLTFVAAFGFVTSGPARAQAPAEERVWVQIEAHGSLAAAEQRIRAYAQLVENVNGFRATTGLYAVALGPYEPEVGELVLAQLLGQGLIPRDSFLEDGNLYATQFFPVGADVVQGDETVGAETAAAEEAVEEVIAEEVVAEEVVAEEVVVEEAVVVEAPEPEPEPVAVPEETEQEAYQSEAALTREERDTLQVALQWFGFYTGGIDGQFGPGTRASMAAYQTDRGMGPTGVLTTRQRAQLLGEYNGELSALGMENVTDPRAGIQIDLPMAMVDFDSYNFPFAQYEEINDSGVRIMLISQPGDRATLFGLYEIMQTLEIVPLEGERERRGDSFLLTGQSPNLRSHTEARLEGGTVKGFTLIWEPSADNQIARVLPMMQTSFAAVQGVLDPAAVPEGLDESIDMVSGLTVRTADLVRSGFFLDGQGTVLTTTEVAGQCEQLLIDNAYPSTVVFRDEALGIAVLRPNQALAPLGFAQLSDVPARLRANIAVAGFPFGGALSSASTTFGELADLRGVNGEENIQRLQVPTADSEAGGPVLDVTGNVIGMVLPGTLEGRTLPEEVTLALRADQLVGPLQEAGISLTLAQPAAGALNRENLSREAADMTVRVSCWN